MLANIVQEISLSPCFRKLFACSSFFQISANTDEKSPSDLSIVNDWDHKCHSVLHLHCHTQWGSGVGAPDRAPW